MRDFSSNKAFCSKLYGISEFLSAVSRPQIALFHISVVSGGREPDMIADGDKLSKQDGIGYRY